MASRARSASVRSGRLSTIREVEAGSPAAAPTAPRGRGRPPKPRARGGVAAPARGEAADAGGEEAVARDEEDEDEDAARLFTRQRYRAVRARRAVFARRQSPTPARPAHLLGRLVGSVAVLCQSKAARRARARTPSLVSTSHSGV